MNMFNTSRKLTAANYFQMTIGGIWFIFLIAGIINDHKLTVIRIIFFLIAGFLFLHPLIKREKEQIINPEEPLPKNSTRTAWQFVKSVILISIGSYLFYIGTHVFSSSVPGSKELNDLSTLFLAPILIVGVIIVLFGIRNLLRSLNKKGE